MQPTCPVRYTEIFSEGSDERYRYVSDLSILHVTLGYNVLKCWRMVAESEIVNRLSFHIPLSQKNVTFLATVPTKEDDLHTSPLWKVASYFSRGEGGPSWKISMRLHWDNDHCNCRIHTAQVVQQQDACSENPQHIDLQPILINTHTHTHSPLAIHF